MGSGKSTIGKQLARRLGWDFVDSDAEIEKRTGVRIADIFAIEGESGFRKWESTTIAELCSVAPRVIATGGGSVLDAQSRQLMQENGWVVYLHVLPQHLNERTRFDRSRPLLQVPDRLAQLTRLYAERDPLYRQIAHHIVNSSTQTSNRITQHIGNEYQKLCKASRSN